MWLATVAVLFVLVAALAWKFGPDLALGGGILISLVVPVWIQTEIWGFMADVRLPVAMWALGIYCIHPLSRFKTRLNAFDYAGIGLLAAHLVSDTLNEGFGLGVVLRAYGEWYVPIVSGRAVNRDTRNYDVWIRIVCYLCVFFAAWSFVESTTRVNPANFVVGARPKDRTPTTALRFGLKRAEGPTTHPIWFGMMQTLLLPYALAGAARAWRGQAPRWLLAAPVASALGVGFTLSRGPILCLVIALLGFAAVQWRLHWRYVLAGLGVALVAAVVWYSEFADFLRWTEGNKVRNSQVELSGVKYKSDATNYRLLLLRAYAKAVREAPLWGYGTDRLATWPPQVPMDADARVIHRNIWSLDNEYLLILLRFGWFGLGCFFAMAALGAYFALRRAIMERASNDVRDLAAGIGAVLAGVVVILAVEWMQTDWGFPLLYTLGFAGSLRDARPGKPQRPVVSRPHRTRGERS